jgi:hypothetical protein
LEHAPFSGANLSVADAAEFGQQREPTLSLVTLCADSSLAPAGVVAHRLGFGADSKNSKPRPSAAIIAPGLCSAAW